MKGFTDPDATYGDGNANDTAGWHEIDLSMLAPANGPVPYRLLVNRFKSSSPDSERFIHDPRTEIMNARGDVDAFTDVNEDWHVSTFVVNHHRTLSVRHVYVQAIVSDTEGTIGLTILKQA
jgi:hypothetical protein